MREETTIKEDKKYFIEMRRSFWCDCAYHKSLDYEYDFEEINPAQFRLSKDNKRIDIFPVGMKFHKIHNDVRGHIGDNLEKFIDENFGPNAKPFKEGKNRRKHKTGKNTNGLTMDSKMPVGKWKGTRMKDVPKTFLKYVYENNYSTAEVLQFVKEHHDEIYE